MLNIKAEYENNKKLKEDIETYGFDAIDKKMYRTFVNVNSDEDSKNKEIIKKNKGLPRALRTIAWEEWFCGDYKNVSEDEKIEKIKEKMTEWYEKVYNENNEEEKSRRNSESRLESILAGDKRNNYYQLLCDAVALGVDGLGTGKMEIPKIKVPLEIIETCKKYNKNNEAILLIATYYHYALKDEDGFIVIEKADFGKWCNGKSKYQTFISDLIKEENKGERILIQNEFEKKIKIIDALKWEDNEEHYMIEFTDNGERGMLRQAKSVLQMIKEVNKVIGLERWKKVPPQIVEELKRLDIEIALNKWNWENELESKNERCWRMTHEQKEKRDKLLEKCGNIKTKISKFLKEND
ncbi:MAG: hypothetical protein ACLT8G_05355 [Lachnospiraceae bacterium]